MAGVLPTFPDGENKAAGSEAACPVSTPDKDGRGLEPGCFQSQPPSARLNEGFSFTLLSP